MLVMSWPDRYFHTQLLTAEHTDPLVFERCGRMLGALALHVARARPGDSRALMYEVATRSAARLGRVTRDALAEPDGGGGHVARAVDEIRYLVDRDAAALYSALDLSPAGAPDVAAKGFADQLVTELRARADVEVSRILAFGGGRPLESVVPKASQAGHADLVASRTPHQLCPGVAGLSYDEIARLVAEMRRHDSGVNWETLRIVADELWNFADGRRTLDDIARAIGFEFGMTVRSEHLLTLARGMEASGALTLGRPSAEAAT